MCQLMRSIKGGGQYIQPTRVAFTAAAAAGIYSTKQRGGNDSVLAWTNIPPFSLQNFPRSGSASCERAVW